MNKIKKIDTHIERDMAHLEDTELLENCNNNRIN